MEVFAKQYVRDKFTHVEVGLDCSGSKSPTKQSCKDECDINRIMAKYLKRGVVDHVAVHGGSYGFASTATFQESMNIVLKAEAMFADLPAKMRERFGNDPGKFLDFCSDKKNLPELRELGLAKPLVAAIVPPSGGTEAPPAKPASGAS